MTPAQANSQGLEEVLYRDSGRRIGGRILHLAEREQGYDRALCGKKRENPLEPNAQGDFCVVCAELYWRKHGHSYREQP